MKSNSVQKFNKFTFALLQTLNSYVGEEKKVTVNTRIKDLFDNDFDDFVWILCLVEIELRYGIEIPDELALDTNQTVLDISIKLKEFPVVEDQYYFDYYTATSVNFRNRIILSMKKFSLVNGDYFGLNIVNRWLDYIDGQDRINGVAELPN